MDDKHRGAVERLVYCKVHNAADAEDVLQDIWLQAWQNQSLLIDPAKRKAWLLGIARHKIADYYRKGGKTPGRLPEGWDMPAHGSMHSPVADTLDALPAKHRMLLERAYLHGYALREIADDAGVPVGTVKSRLHAAREAFRQEYEKGEIPMKMTFPKTLPEIEIIESKLPAFSVDCLEAGWFFRVKEGEASEWAEYDLPGLNGRGESELTSRHSIRYAGKTIIHGVAGLVFDVQSHYLPDNEITKRWFAMQRTDSHVRWIAEAHEEDGAKKLSTFLDDDFLRIWGEGHDNIGEPTHRPAESLHGRFTVKIGGKSHDCVRLRRTETGFFDRYINAEGRTVLSQHYTTREVLAQRGCEIGGRAEIAEHQGREYVHWYDCIPDFVL